MDKYRIIVRNAHDKSTNDLISKLSSEQTTYIKYSRTLASQRTCLREKAEKAALKISMLEKNDGIEDMNLHILERNAKSARLDDGPQVIRPIARRMCTVNTSVSGPQQGEFISYQDHMISLTYFFPEYSSTTHRTERKRFSQNPH
jgi:hypothetical protein